MKYITVLILIAFSLLAFSCKSNPVYPTDKPTGDPRLPGQGVQIPDSLKLK